MGSITGAEAQRAVELGWSVPTGDDDVIVVGRYRSATSRFRLAGLPEHRQIVRHGPDGHTTTARPATYEEIMMYDALRTALERLAGLTMQYEVLNNQLGALYAEREASR